MAAETDDSDPMAAFRNRQAPLPEFPEELDVLYAPEAPATGFYAEPEAVQAEPAAAFALPEPESAAPPAAAPLSPAAERLLRAELSDLSQLELIERLALSLQRRGQVAAAAPFLAAYQPEPEPEAHVSFEPEALAPAAVMPVEAAGNVDPGAPRLSLPAAMRPIDFSEYEHDEDMPEYVPARSIAMPPFKAVAPSGPVEPSLAEAAEPPVAPAMPRFGRPTEVEEPAAPSEEEVLEAGYSSLLDMTRPAGQRHQFVRVADPEAETEAAEPVVIFPGQAMRAGTRFAQPPQGPVVAPSTPLPSLGDAPGQARRFDAPPAQAQFAPASAPVRNPEETERALRSALSTLQRMSGAA